MGCKSWNEMYIKAKSYYEDNGNLLITDTSDVENTDLRLWLIRQRMHYKRQKLSKEKIELLNNLGMIWSLADYQWCEQYNVAVEYYKEHGNLLVPRDYGDDKKLAQWIAHQRQKFATNRLSTEKIELLDKIGIVWSVKESQWSEHYELAVKYYKEYGNLLVPQRYETKDKVQLGIWISLQRKAYKSNKITTKRIKLLEEIGMVWNPAEVIWNETYEIAKQYYEENHNLNIPDTFFYKNVSLGSWVITQRINYNQNTLTERQIKLLNEIGISWVSTRNKKYIWDHNYDTVVKFYNKYKHLYIPTSYISEDGIHIGRWLYEQGLKYRANKLSEYRKRKLDMLDKSWLEPANTKTSFPEQAVLHYVRKHFPSADKLNTEQISEIDIYIPELKVGIEYDGPSHSRTVKTDIRKSIICKNMGIELIRIRDCKCPFIDDESYKIILTDDSFEALEWGIIELLRYLKVKQNAISVSIKRDYIEISDNFIKSIDVDWYTMYEKLKEYYDEYGDINVPIYYKTADGSLLGHWLSNIRSSYKKPNLANIRLTTKKIELLEQLGMDWSPMDTQWESKYLLAEEYYNQNGNLLVPDKYVTPDNIKLGRWIATQRNDYKKNKLSKEIIASLERIGMVWSVYEYEWMKMYDRAVAYYNEYGDLLMPNDYTIDGDICLGSWLSFQKKQYRADKLPEKKVALLNKIGIDWQRKSKVYSF